MGEETRLGWLAEPCMDHEAFAIAGPAWLAG
jgi:hypothetical protein